MTVCMRQGRGGNVVGVIDIVMSIDIARNPWKETAMSADEHVPTVADLVNRLFAQRLHPSGREYSNREVGIALRWGHKNPAVHLHRLRAGFIKNPTRETILDLCRFFRVPPAYFYPELERERVVFEPLPDDQDGRAKKPA